jgi:hypothetical protein
MRNTFSTLALRRSALVEYPRAKFRSQRETGESYSCPRSLLSDAAIKFPRLKALRAGTAELFVAGNLLMSAIVTNKPPMRERCHLSKLIVFDAVRAPNYRHIHCGVHPVIRFWLGLLAAGFYARMVTGM